MSKILEKEFRNELYKNLCEAGYDKQESQRIVSVKYRDALKASFVDSLKAQASNIQEGKEELILSVDEYSNFISEICKLDEFFKKIEKTS